VLRAFLGVVRGSVLVIGQCETFRRVLNGYKPFLRGVLRVLGSVTYVFEWFKGSWDAC
jgi:hypothetical protein